MSIEYNGEFQIIYTRGHAYLLGLLMADGCLYYNTTSGAYQVKLKLKGEDSKILYKIQKRFPFFCTPQKEKSCPSESEFIYCYSKQLYNDIRLKGILPKKTHENSELVFISDSIPNEFLGDYIRGFYDGDGTIYQENNGSIRCDVKCNNRRLCKDIVELFKSFNISSSYYHRKDQDQYMVRISKKKDTKKFIDFINTDSDFIIDRKFKPFFDINWDRIPGYDNMHEDYKTLFVRNKRS